MPNDRGICDQYTPATLSVLALLIASGCQCDGETLVRVAPRIEVELESIDFGEVPVGATKRVLLRIDNTGTADLTIVTATTSAPFAAEVVDTLVTPGGTGLIDVLFRPTNDEPQTATLQIESSDEDTPMVSVALSGVGVEGVIVVAPTVADFGDTTVGSTRGLELLMSNFGLEAATGRVTAEGFVRPEHFSMTSLADFSSAGTFTVGARSQSVLDIEYRPLELGEDAGRIVFETCGERCGVEVEVRGTGADSAIRLRPAAIDFGTMGIGETKTAQVIVENLGNEVLTIQTVSGAGGSGLVVTPLRNVPLELAPSETLAVTVELTALAADAIRRSVVVRSNDVVLPEARAAIVAEGQGPQFAVVPETISFGVQREAITYDRPLLLVNSGSTPVMVESVTIAGDMELALGPLPGLPARLGAGESLLLQVTFSPTAIREYRATVTVTSDDPASSMVEVPVLGGLADRICEIDAAPQQLNFGSMPPGFFRRLTTTLTNVGFDTCTVTGADFRAPIDPAFTLVNAPWPLTLMPNEQATLEFQFAPMMRIDSKANLTMHTTDPVFPERHVSLIGTGAGNIEVFTDPETVDFGVVAPQCRTPQRQVHLYNTGNLDVTVDQIVLTSSTTELTFNTANRPFTLAGGGSETISLEYAPVDFDHDTAILEIVVRELLFPLVVPVEGTGAPTPQATDVFQQRTADKVDVLFVIDDSCSMGDDQAELAANFSAFIHSANVRQVDFQIGITTTTLAPIPGNLVGDLMNRNTPNLTSQFQAQANVGITGSGFERGLDAMQAAFLRAANGQGQNAGLLRPGAARVVVIVTDEDDSSTGAAALYFQDLRSRSPHGYTVIIVSGGPNGCTDVRTGRAADPTPRYEAFRSLSQGVNESICNDWGQTLTRIGNAAFGLSAFFVLQSRVAPGTQIEVYVDGQPASGWMYDMTSNAIEFATPPPAGATIRVVYVPEC